MTEKPTFEECCRKILESNGGAIADKARKLLLEDPALKNLRPPLEFISKNWRDQTPALTSLSCESVGGRKEETYDVSLAMCLMHLSFYIWDDMLDNTRCKLFKPTFFGKFGAETSLIVGGLASAKAFSILNELNLHREKRQTIFEEVWGLWTSMATAETRALTLQSEKRFYHMEKLWKINIEAKDTEASLRIGAIIGNGSRSEISHLGNYGLCLGIILKLWNDFRVSVNLTLELADKIRGKRLPYPLLWASEQSQTLRKKLDILASQDSIGQSQIKEIVEELLATRAFNHTNNCIKKYTEKAEKELSYLAKNTYTRTLQSLIEAQSQLLIESLPNSQMRES